MKIDRQIGILSVLLQRETVTAPFLAGQFEVSRRTINRDIDDLCKAELLKPEEIRAEIRENIERMRRNYL